MRDSDQLKSGVVLSYLQMALSILIGLIYTPIMIRLLGINEYGLYSTISSTISMLSILNLGFSSSYIRYYSKYKSAHDSKGISTVNGLFLILFLIIGVIALFLGFLAAFHLQWIFDTGLTAHEYGIARKLMVLLTINLAISFPMTVFSCAISAEEKFFFLKLISVIVTVATPILTLPLLFLGMGSVGVVSITLLGAIVTNTLYLIYAFKRLKITFKFKGISTALVKDLLSFTCFIAINIVIDQINLNIDKLLLGRFKGTEAVAIYSVGFSLYSYYQMFSVSISNVFVPRIHKIVNDSKTYEKLKKEITELFIKVGRIQFLILGLIASGFVLFGRQFISLWVGDGYRESYYVLLLLALPATVPLIQNLGIEIQRAENKHQFRSIVYFLMALVNFILTIYLCQLYGPIGGALGTCISFVLMNGIVMNIYYHKKCAINILAFWKNIGKMSLGFVAPVLLEILIQEYFKMRSFVEFFIHVCIYALMYFVSMWLLSMNQDEKNIIKSVIRKRTGK